MTGTEWELRINPGVIMKVSLIADKDTGDPLESSGSVICICIVN